MNLDLIKPQNLGCLLLKLSQSSFDLRSPSSFLVRSYLITTVIGVGREFEKFLRSLECYVQTVKGPNNFWQTECFFNLFQKVSQI
jgi:hypothetical protein